MINSETIFTLVTIHGRPQRVAPTDNGRIVSINLIMIPFLPPNHRHIFFVIAFTCSGLVPQQPPKICAPAASHSFAIAPISAGVTE